MLNSCRDEVVKAVKAIIKQKEKNEFSPQEVISYMRNNGTQYQESTIRTHVVSRCCMNARQHHQTKYWILKGLIGGYIGCWGPK